MPIIDTHNHLYFGNLQTDLDSILTASREALVTKQILIGIDEISNRAAIKLAQEHENFKVTLGLHPCDVDQIGKPLPEGINYPGFENYAMKCNSLDDFFQDLENLYLANKNLVVGFGETGFDQFHRSNEKLLKLQIESFHRHLELCEKYQKTLVIHSRATTAVGLEELQKNKSKIEHFPVIWHCFDDNAEVAEKLTSMGIYLGIGGIATYSKSDYLREAIVKTPLEYLITETDAPFLTPNKARKKGAKFNQPSFLPEVVELIAELKNISVDTCEKTLYQNGLKAFDLTDK